MLKLARFRGGGLFVPRNDGPLMTGASFAAAARAGGGFRVGAGAGAAAAGAEAAESAVDCVAAACAGADTTAEGADSSVAPHMPQKRFPPGFSLPQRAQRTNPPRLRI